MEILSFIKEGNNLTYVRPSGGHIQFMTQLLHRAVYGRPSVGHIQLMTQLLHRAVYVRPSVGHIQLMIHLLDCAVYIKFRMSTFPLIHSHKTHEYMRRGVGLSP